MKNADQKPPERNQPGAQQLAKIGRGFSRDRCKADCGKSPLKLLTSSKRQATTPLQSDYVSHSERKVREMQANLCKIDRAFPCSAILTFSRSFADENT
jgi:hypothetical protein